MLVRGGKLTPGDHVTQSVNSCLEDFGYTQRFTGRLAWKQRSLAASKLGTPKRSQNWFVLVEI